MNTSFSVEFPLDCFPEIVYEKKLIETHTDLNGLRPVTSTMDIFYCTILFFFTAATNAPTDAGSHTDSGGGEGEGAVQKDQSHSPR